MTNRRPTRAISIRQPYVEGILRGVKQYEYRTRPTTIKEVVYLYASIKDGDYAYFSRWIKARPGDFPIGVIVGTVEIAGCRFRSRSGDYAYILKNPRRLKRPLRPLNQPQPVFWRPVFK